VLTGSPTAGSPVEFFGEPEEDADGIITKLDWNFGDGTPVVDARSASHTYGAAGTYEVTLTATDICGESESVHALVTVAAKPGGEGGGSGGGGTAPAPVPPAPAPALTGKVALPTAIAARKGGRAKVKLTCTGTASGCTGELLLSVKRVVRVNGHKRTRTVVIGKLKFNIVTGRATTLSMQLNSTGKRLLRAAHHLKGLLTLKQTGPAPGKGSVGVRVNLVRK